MNIFSLTPDLQGHCIILTTMPYNPCVGKGYMSLALPQTEIFQIINLKSSESRDIS